MLRSSAFRLVTLALALAAAGLRAEEAPRVQRAIHELEAIRSIAAEVTNAQEQILWQTRIELAEKEVGNARRLVELEEQERSLVARQIRTPRELLREQLRTVETDTETPLARIREHDERVRELKALRADRAADLQRLTGTSEEIIQRRADIEQTLRNFDVELQAHVAERDAGELQVRLARDAAHIDEYMRNSDLVLRPTVQNILEKRRATQDAAKEADDYLELEAALRQQHAGVAEGVALARERFSHLDEEIRTLANLYDTVRRPIFSLKSVSPQQEARQHQVGAMLAEARSQRANLEERLEYSDRLLAALREAQKLADVGRVLQEHYATYLRHESQQLAERFQHRIGTPAVIIGVMLLIFLVITRIILPLVRSRDSLFVARRMWTYILVLATIAVLALSFLEDLRAIATILGIAGAAVVIALQDLCAAFAGWFVIMASGKLKVGDRVEIDGHRGDVIDIQLLRTTLLEVNSWLECDEPTGRVMVVPNSFIFKSQFFNYSHLHPYIWDKLDVMVQFESPIHETYEVLDRVLREETAREFEAAREGSKRVERQYGLSDAVYEPRIQLKLGHSGTVFTLFFVAHFRDIDDVRSRIVNHILVEFAGDPRLRIAYRTQREGAENSPVTYAQGARRS